MGFTIEGKHLTKCFQVSKDYEATCLCKIFQDRQWNVVRVKTLYWHDWQYRPTAGSGRPRSARTSANITQLRVSHSAKKINHRHTIVQWIGMSLGSVNTITKKDLKRSRWLAQTGCLSSKVKHSTWKRVNITSELRHHEYLTLINNSVQIPDFWTPSTRCSN